MQDEFWLDQTGREWKLEELTDDHRRNLIAWLERRAELLRLSFLMTAYDFLMTLRGEQAGYAMEDAISDVEDQEPIEWLRTLPLVKRLHELERAKCN